MLRTHAKRSVVRLATLAALVGLMLLGPSPALGAATTVTYSTTFPIDIAVFVPCAAGGAGEVAYLSGNLHELFHITFDGRGGFHAKSHYNPQGVSGIGATTGDKYQGTGVSQLTFNGKVGSVTTFVNNFRIIGQGPGNNLLVHSNLHITVNANGTVTAFHDNFRVECR